MLLGIVSRQPTILALVIPEEGGGPQMYPAFSQPAAADFGSIVQSTNAASAGTASKADSVVRDAMTFKQVGLANLDGAAHLPLNAYSSAHSTWEWTVGFMAQIPPRDFCGAGICLADDTGRIMNFIFGSAGTIGINSYTANGGTYDASQNGLTVDDIGNWFARFGFIYLRMSYDGTNITFSVSADGENFDIVGLLVLASSEFDAQTIDKIALYLGINEQGRNAAVANRASDVVAMHVFHSVYGNT